MPNRTKANDRLKLVILCLNKEKDHIIVDPDNIWRQKDFTDIDDVYNKIMSLFKDKVCCYALYDCFYDTTEHSEKKELVFISWYGSAPLHLCASAPLHLCTRTSAPLRLHLCPHTSAPAPLRLCTRTSAPLPPHLCPRTSAPAPLRPTPLPPPSAPTPLHLCTRASAPLHLRLCTSAPAPLHLCTSAPAPLRPHHSLSGLCMSTMLPAFKVLKVLQMYIFWSPHRCGLSCISRLEELVRRSDSVLFSRYPSGLYQQSQHTGN